MREVEMERCVYETHGNIEVIIEQVFNAHSFLSLDCQTSTW
ncbi:MAG: hypothetical protein ACXV3U_03110 [Halobacteriota archaeon]